MTEFRNENDARERARLPVVGIGASAGGIDALRTLFANLPTDLGAAYVVVVHLDPGHESELPHLLSARTAMNVVQVTESQHLEPDTVYVIAPNRRLLITDHSIASAAFEEPRGQRAPIDSFFRSLANQHGDGFAVVLSGGGSDGALGVRVMKENGGIILVQDPNEAEFSSMPRSAIASAADFVLPVVELASQLAALVSAKKQSGLVKVEEGNEDSLRRILAYLRTKTGQDFSRYKRATLLRRVARRMQVAQTERLEQYLTYLREHADEVQALFNDLLISVTSFFRDRDAFGILATAVIPRLFDAASRDAAVRVWIPACATGEEAYSIAILLLEEAARHDARPDIQIFATDLDDHALATAREGRYPQTIATDISDERLRRFFLREGDQYRIRREVRDLIVFASHSLLKDPPFSKINLISCRNLLIYLDRDLQQQVCSVLHYALTPHGFLFLGASESAENPPGLFTVFDREARIYQATDRPRDKLAPLPRLLTTVRLPEIPEYPRPPRATPSIDVSVHRVALEEIAPPSLLVDENHLIVNLSETCGRYLLHSSGPITSDAAEVVRPELRLELRAALHRAFEGEEASVTLPMPVRFDGVTKTVVMSVRPVKREDAPRAALVLFLEGGVAEPRARDGAPDNSSTAVAQLREELHATRTVLRTTREQYEGATEELRAANEELQSINEEYRSTAEELETSKEELQSINEELQTLNNELKLKLDMVSRAHNDLQNLMSATDVSTMFLNGALRIERFTPRMSELFNIVPGDEGRPVTDFTHRLDYQDLVLDAQRVLADLIPVERTVRATTGRWYLMRLRPYRTLDDKIDGIVATFVDVTERREAEAAWATRQTMLLNELSYRVRNTLAVVQSITRSTLRESGLDPQAVQELDARIQALSSTHELLVQNEWRGASVEALARQQLAPYLAGDRVQLSGPSVTLPPNVATPIGLALHELGTNAAKYGALSGTAGKVYLTWQVRQLEDGVRRLEMTWSESGGPEVKPPAAKSTGTALIETGIPEAHVERRFEKTGVVCMITVELADTREREMPD